MNLMGTWITGYLDGLGAVAGEDYDFFEFPTFDPAVPNAVVGPVDTFAVAAAAKNPDGAKQLLAFLSRPRGPDRVGHRPGRPAPERQCRHERAQRRAPEGPWRGRGIAVVQLQL